MTSVTGVVKIVFKVGNGCVPVNRGDSPGKGLETVGSVTAVAVGGAEGSCGGLPIAGLKIGAVTGGSSEGVGAPACN